MFPHDKGSRANRSDGTLSAVKALTRPSRKRSSRAGAHDHVDQGLSLGVQIGLDRDSAALLASLRNPGRIQNFVNDIPWTHGEDGVLARSVSDVLEQRLAKCIEGALVAACALWLAGEPPLLMDLGAVGDVDHVVALFRRRGLWGAISKSNSPYLRFRDPIYRSMRELAISFFPQYLKGRRKTLRTYSVPLDLRRHHPSLWVVRRGDCPEIVDALTTIRHFPIVPEDATDILRPADGIEVAGSQLRQFPDSEATPPGEQAATESG